MALFLVISVLLYTVLATTFQSGVYVVDVAAVEEAGPRYTPYIQQVVDALNAQPWQDHSTDTHDCATYVLFLGGRATKTFAFVKDSLKVKEPVVCLTFEGCNNKPWNSIYLSVTTPSTSSFQTQI